MSTLTFVASAMAASALATARPCGCTAHSAALRTFAPAHPRIRERVLEHLSPPAGNQIEHAAARTVFIRNVSDHCALFVEVL